MDVENYSKAAPIVSSVLLVVIAVMANAYWVEAVRWADKADAAEMRDDTQAVERCVRHMKRAKIIFQLVAVLMLATLLATIVPILFPQMFIAGVAVNLVSTALIGLLCVIYASGKFLVPLR